MYRKVIKNKDSYFVRDDTNGTHTILMLLVDDYNLKSINENVLNQIKELYSEHKWKDLMKINNRLEITSYMCCDERHTKNVFENIINYYNDCRQDVK